MTTSNSATALWRVIVRRMGTIGMTARAQIGLSLCLAFGAALSARGAEPAGEELFTGPVPRLRIEIPAEGMAVLRDYVQVWRQPRPERIDVRATVGSGDMVYTNVAIHLKGSFTFQPIDDKPSLTLNFDKFAPGQRFHGLTKIHLNNSIQDPSHLCEQFARELFVAVGVPAPRATPALLTINGRNPGIYVLVEGANKPFVKRNFASTSGNLYDGGSGGDVTRALEADSGEHPDDRSDLASLVKAAREPDPARRLEQLERVLDVDRFIRFAATEVFIVHWDGYAISHNNYRVFHDVARDKMVFIPHGLDQLFGVSSSPGLSITPAFKGFVARMLFSVPEARQQYLERLNTFYTNEFTFEKLHARVDRLSARLRPALNKSESRELDQSVDALKSRMARRIRSVAEQLARSDEPVPFPDEGSIALSGWSFKGGPTHPAAGSRAVGDGRQILRVTGRGTQSSGAWRTTLLLRSGQYEFTGLGRTRDIDALQVPGTNGMLLRISGERSTEGIAITDEWKRLKYRFDVHGVEAIELICEFRGPSGSGEFDAGSLRLRRIRPESVRPRPDQATSP